MRDYDKPFFYPHNETPRRVKLTPYDFSVIGCFAVDVLYFYFGLCYNADVKFIVLGRSKMKKILSAFIVICVMLSFVSCAGNESDSPQITSNNYLSSQNSNIQTSSELIDSTSSEITSLTEEESSNSSKNDTVVISSNTDVTSELKYKQATDNDRNVVVDNSGIVSITIPKWFLFKMEADYNYQLTDAEKNSYKFISVAKNGDGSATYKIGYNDYHRFLLISQSNVNAVVYKYKNNIWFSETKIDAGYNNIHIYTKYNNLEEFDDDFGVYIAMSGLQTTFYQYINYNCSVGTTITVYNKDNVVLQTYKFPELIM